jgi:hypothetical protein
MPHQHSGPHGGPGRVRLDTPAYSLIPTGCRSVGEPWIMAPLTVAGLFLRTACAPAALSVWHLTVAPARVPARHHKK